MTKFVNCKDDYVLKYAYYKEKVAGFKFLDEDLEKFNISNKTLRFELDKENEFDSNAIKLFNGDLFIGYVHKNFIQEMINAYADKKDYQIEISWNELNFEKKYLQYQIGFYKKYDKRNFDILNRFELKVKASEDRYYNLDKNKYGLYFIKELNQNLSSEESNRIKEYLKNESAILLKGKKNKNIEAIVVI